MKTISYKKGFTLVETLVAILILVVAISALFTLASNSLFSVRSAKNQSTALYLAQEAMDYIRSTRDDATLQLVPWQIWIDYFNVDGGGTQIPSGGFPSIGCYSPQGCTLDVVHATVSSSAASGLPPRTARECTAKGCDFFMFYKSAAMSFYGYTANPYPFAGLRSEPSGFSRVVHMRYNPTNLDQVIVEITVEWYNTQNSTSTESLTITQNFMNL